MWIPLFKYSFESIYLTALQQLVIETTSPDDWDSSYDCEIFVWKDFSGEPIDSNANWKYTPITVGTPPQTPPGGSGDLTGGTDDLTLGGGGVSLG